MLRLVNKYKPLLTQITNVTVGRTAVELSNHCSLEECNFGNLIADSYVYYVRNFGFNINFCRLKKKKKTSEESLLRESAGILVF